MAGFLLSFLLAVCLMAAAVTAQTPQAFSIFFQSFPACSVAVDSSSNIYVSYCNQGGIIQKFNSAYQPLAAFNTAAASTLASLSSNSASSPNPFSLAVSASGQLWFLDNSNSRLVALNSLTSPSSTSTIPLATVDGAFDISISSSSSNVWVLYLNNQNQLQQLAPNGTVLSILGPSNSPALVDYFAVDLFVDSTGNVYVSGCYPSNSFSGSSGGFSFNADNVTACDLRKISPTGALLQTFTNVGTDVGFANFSFFASIAVTSSGDVYAADDTNSPVLHHWSASGVQTAPRSASPAPATLAASPSGDLIALSGSGFTVLDYTSTGTNEGSFNLANLTFSEEVGVAFSPNSAIVYLSSTNGGAIASFNSSGGFLGYLASTAVAEPQGIAVDSAGLIYVADAATNTVFKLSSSGSTLQSFSDPQTPFSFDTAQGWTSIQVTVRSSWPMETTLALSSSRPAAASFNASAPRRPSVPTLPSPSPSPTPPPA